MLSLSIIHGLTCFANEKINESKVFINTKSVTATSNVTEENYLVSSDAATVILNTDYVKFLKHGGYKVKF